MARPKGTKRKLDSVAQQGSSSKSKKAKQDDQKAVVKDLHVPVDKGFYIVGTGTSKVYVDDKGVIYDVSLNQTNFAESNNSNKFYRIQVLERGTQYYTHVRWGRVGNFGQTKTVEHDSLPDALNDFEKKFKEKTGHVWDERHAEPKKGKYTFLQMSYEEDEQHPNDESNSSMPPPKQLTMAESELPEPIQRLMELIFNEQHFDKVLEDIGYNKEKLPLGKLGKPTLKKGFEYLRELGSLINIPNHAQNKHGKTQKEAIEDFTNRYYSTIPHMFGMKKGPLINNIAVLKREAEMLDTLSDMEVTNEIMKSTAFNGNDVTNILDQRFKELNLNEMTALEHESKEFSEISKYLTESTGHTHGIKYDLKEVFRIERPGEHERFQKSEFAQFKIRNPRLLWHGSRTTNFGGILSQGLRIAPPEAPVNGYAFGKGVYLADISSKSANYCVAHMSSDTGCLLLCEAELGTPMFELSTGNSAAEELCKANKCIATKGIGKTVPKQWKDAGCVHKSLRGVLMPTNGAVDNLNNGSSYLQYNEYIVYDVAQVRLRYLLQVGMKQ